MVLVNDAYYWLTEDANIVGTFVNYASLDLRA
jgi:hypothetical protein